MSNPKTVEFKLESIGSRTETVVNIYLDGKKIGTIAADDLRGIPGIRFSSEYLSEIIHHRGEPDAKDFPPTIWGLFGDKRLAD